MSTAETSGRPFVIASSDTPIRRRHPYRATLVALAVLALSVAGATAETVKTNFNIGAKPAREALTDYARQAQVQLGYADSIVEGVLTNAVIGEFESARALELLLKDTGLVAEHGERGIFIRRVRRGAAGSGIEGPLRPTEEPNTTGTAAATQSASQPRTAPNARYSPPPERPEEPIQIEEILVTGTHIRGVESTGATSIAFTREEISNTGFSTVQELFEGLPQNLDEISADGAVADGVSRTAGGNTAGASSISLRGLGPGSTLILLNGKRRPSTLRGLVVDISSIPLSMVERIEVVTGGRSATYGSDAVAGVVNIVTSSAFDGAETQVYYGSPSDSGERINFSQTFGRTFDKGGFVVGYDYSRDHSIDAAETGLVRAPSIIGLSPVPGLFNLTVDSEQHAGAFAGHYEISDSVELYADTLFSADKNESGRVSDFFGIFEIGGPVITESDQYSAVGGARIDIGQDWRIDVSGLYGVAESTVGIANLFTVLPDRISLDVPLELEDLDESTLTSFSVIADGPVHALGSGKIFAAVGVDFRTESYERTRFSMPDGTPVPNEAEDRDRDIWSIFGEVHVPLLENGGQRLELSLAGRYDDYSDFGGTFNPQLGIEWAPANTVTFRGTYAEAFRAPNLFDLAFRNFVNVRELPDPADPTGMTTATLFTELGGNADLEPEEAETWTVGLDWEPTEATRLALSYFSIEYTGRIDEPTTTPDIALIDEALFADLVIRNPASEQLAAVLDRQSSFDNRTGIPFDPASDDPFSTFSNVVLFDNRFNNIGIEEVNGVDLQASTSLETGLGDWSFHLNGTYYLDFTRNITPTSPTIEQLNQPGKTVDLKLRGRVGWSREAWNVNAFLNYVDSYEDTIAATPTKISSWTTVDLTIKYDASRLVDGGFFDGMRATLGVDNLFDEDPPVFLSNTFGLGFDSANADAIGRFVSLRLSKRW